MANTFADQMARFLKRYEHLSLAEYVGREDLILEIPDVISNLSGVLVLKDVIGRNVDVGDVIAMGHPRYVDVRVGVVLGYTPKNVRVAIFRESQYQDMTGIGHPTFINGSFVIIRKKFFKRVDSII